MTHPSLHLTAAIRRFCFGLPMVRSIRALALLVAAGVTLSESVAAGATYYWDTNGTTAGSGAVTGTWGTSTFWSTDSTGVLTPTVTLTTNTDDLFIAAGTNGTAGTITISGAQTANSITFDDAVAVTLSGGTSITLGGGGGTGTGIFQTAAAANIISTGIILGASSTSFALSNSSASLLTIGAITGAATSGTQTLNISSSSTGGITLNGIIGNGAAGGNVGLLVNNTGTGVTTLSGVNTYTGGTTITAGTVAISAAAGLGASTSSLTLNGGTLNVTQSILSTNFAHPITVGAGGGTLQVTNTTGGTTSQLTLNNANTLLGNGTLTIVGNGTLTDGSTFQGNLALNNANTYSGNIILQSGGNLEINSNSAVGSGATFNVNSAGELIVDQGITLGHAVTVNGGELSFNNGGSGIIAGNVTLNGTGAAVRLANFYNTAVQNGTISGNVSGTGGLTILNFAATLMLTGANTYTGATVIGTGATLVSAEPVSRTYGNVISGAGAFIKSGPGTLTLTGASIYTGATTIRGGTLQVGDGTSGSLASTTTLTFGDTGTFNAQGISTGSSQNLGTTTFSAGDGTVQSTYGGTSGNTVLTLANVAARTAGATGNFVVSGGANGSTNKIVLTQVAGATPATGTLLDKGYFFNGGSYAAYDTSAYVRAYGTGDTGYVTATGSNAIASTSTNNVALTGNVTAQATAAINTLNLGANTLALAPGAVFQTNGILESGSGAATISGGTSLSTTTSAGELVIRVNLSTDALNISTPVINNGTSSLTKSGLGTLTLSAAGNTYAGVTIVDSGTLTLSGTYTGGGAFTVRNSATLNINGASNGNIIVAPATGVGIANVNAAVTLANSNSIAVGSAGGVGVLNVAANISGGNQAINVGTGGVGSLGVVNVTAGTITPGAFLVAGFNNGSSGIWNISGGAVATTGNNGGTLGIGGTNSFNTGVLNITSGSYSSTNTTASGLSGIYVGEGANGTGILNLSGTGVANLGGVSTSVALNIGRSNGATGIVNLGAVGVGGGTINTFRVQKTGSTATGTFNFHGGTLQASTGANSTFMTGLTAAYVYSEGGTINNNAQAITIGQALLAPAGSGVSSLALSGTTTGFTPGATPLVMIVGGGGTGATAVANVDGSGSLTITLTNPGTGYTSAPFVTFIGATASGVPVATASLGANTSGGLTFQGSGTTTLAGASTYTGGTTVSAGTLAYGVSNALADTGAINVNGGTLNVATFNDTVGAVTLTSGAITGSTGVLSGSSYDVRSGTVSGILGGTGATLTKTTAGTVTLSSVNTYTGATTVNAGTLTVSGTGSINTSSGLTINGSGAKLVQTSSVTLTPTITLTQGTLDGTGTVGAVTVGSGTGGVVSNGNGSTAMLTLGALAFNGAGTLSLNKADDTSSTVALAITGALTTTPANGQITLNLLTGPIWANGSTYNLISYGSFGGANADFSVGSIAGLGARQSATVGNTGAGSGFITLAIAGDTPVWTGLTSGAWTTTAIGGPQNWKLQTAGTGTEFLSNDQVVFDDTAAGTTTVTINDATVAPASVVFNNSTKAYILSGSNGITTGTLAKNGTGSVTINTANTYSGGTTLSSGTLNLNNASAIGTGAFTINGGTLDNSSGSAITLTTSNAQTWNGDFTFTGSNALNLGTGAVALGASAQVTVNGSNLTVGGVISGSGFGVTKAGTGILTFTAANTYTGGTTVSAGTLNSSNAAGLGTGSVGISSGANVVLNVGSGTSTVVVANAFTGAGTINVSNLGTTSGTVQLSGVLSGFTGTLTIGGGGGKLSFTNTTQGNVISSSATINVLSGGTLYLNTGLSYGSSITLNGGTTGEALGQLRIESGTTIAGNVSLAAGTTIGGNTTTGTISGVISGSGFGVTRLGSGTTILTNANTYTGTTTISAGTLQLGSGGTTGALSTSSAIVDNGTLAFNRTNAVTQGADFSAAAITGTGGVTQLGTGTLTFNASNTYTGTTILKAGTLAVTAGTTGGAAADIQISPASTDTGTLNVSGGTVTAQRVIIGGNTANNGTPGAGTVIQSGGTINSRQWFTVGSGVAGPNTGASGVYTMTGGTLNVNAATGTNMEVANFTGTTGTVTMSGASAINLLNNASINLGANANAGNGTFTQSGGTVTFYSDAGTTAGGTGGVILGTAATIAATSTFTYNLNGGTLLAPQISRNASGTNLSSGIFNFNGGTLKAAKANTTFMTGLTTANVRDGGAIIDTNTFAITIGQALVHSTVGGDNATDGGLTKNGTGTLTLSGANTYTGGTTLNGGTLLANNTTGSALGTGSVNVAAAGTLGGSGAIALAADQLIIINGALVVGNPGDIAGVDLNLSTSGTGGTLLGAASTLYLDIFSGAGAGDNSGNALAADILRFSGSLDITVGATLSLGNPNSIASGSWAAGDTFRLFDWTSLVARTGTFAVSFSDLDLPSSLTLDTSGLYSSGVVSLVAVPEPGRVALLLCGLGIGFLRRRRLSPS